MKKNVIVLDTKLIAYWFYHRKQSMSNIINMLPNIVPIKPDIIYSAWDMNKSKYRLDLLPTYKGSRKKYKNNKTAEEKAHLGMFEYQYLHNYKPILEALGIVSLNTEAEEADDIISLVAHKFGNNENYNVYIISADEDLGQLLKFDNVFTIPPSPVVEIRDRSHIEKTYECSPEEFLFYKTICGDDGDSIRSLVGVSKGKTKKIMNDIRETDGTIDRTSVIDYLKRLVIDKPKLVIHPEYQDIGITTIEDMVDINLKLVTTFVGIDQLEDKEDFIEKFNTKPKRLSKAQVEATIIASLQMPYQISDNAARFFKLSP